LALYDRLEELDAAKAKAKAGYILHGLGFTKEMQNTKVILSLSYCFNLSNKRFMN
jgi:ATPase subunit of ABC transporter with duplicated ATPase domains